LNCLSPEGEFSNRLKRVLDLSKNVLDKAKRDLGNSLLTIEWRKPILSRWTIDNYQ
jgi:hypothetical protein